MTAIVIDTIRQDSEGRFCPNDLHHAAGGEPRHTPCRFTITDTFQELVEELSRNQDKSPVTAKRGVGTFVCKELVYAYAMWISPQLHLKVIRAYDRLAPGGAWRGVRPASARLSASMIWLSVKRDFFMLEILL